MSAKSTKEKNGKAGFFVIILLIAVVAAAYYFYIYDKPEPRKYIEPVDSTKLVEKQLEEEQQFIKAATDTNDTTEKIIFTSAPNSRQISYELDEKAGRPVRYVYRGRRINIAVTGLDNRLGTRSNHADANHVISFLLDSGLVEITSVPRDTYADAGMDDSTGLNKLTIVRANRGREKYLSELARITGIDKIHYYIEGGFSQVMGIIEFFGFKDSKSTLQVLRSRTGLGGDDYQRSYNQGQFMRQLLLRHFKKFTGLSGELLIRGGLTILETNLTTAVVKDIIDRLEVRGFPRNNESVTVHIRPPMYNKFKIYDFSDEGLISSLTNKIENFNQSYISDSNRRVPNPLRIIRNKLDLAAKDTAKNPQRTINTLNILFQQRAWLQIQDPEIRDSIRNEFGILLSTAYTKRNQIDKAKNVWYIINTEKELFNRKLTN